MSDRPRLSGWCSPSDQFHDGCRSAACECSAHVDAQQNKGKQGRIGRADKVRQHPAGSDRPTRVTEQRG